MAIKKEQIQYRPWEFDTGVGILVTDDLIPEWAVGFVYTITEYCMGSIVKTYVGKKLLTSTRKQKIGKRAIAAEKVSRVDGKAHTVKKVVKDSGWRNYVSSCKPLQERIKQHPELFRRVILQWAHSKKHLSYLETKYQFRLGVLECDSWNDNIAGKWFRKDLINQKEAQ